MDRTRTYYDLLEALTEQGCPVCRICLAAVHRYIGAINYESVGDPGIREHLRASLGFCNVHAHQWLAQAHILGTAQIYADVLTQTLSELRALPFRSQTFMAGVSALLGSQTIEGSDRGALAPRGQCPVCRVLAETEEMVIRTLLATIAETASREAYAGSTGLCLPHLRQALAQTTGEVAFAALRDVAVAQEERLLAQLREVTRKSDYRFMNEPAGAERGAAARAVQHVTGVPGIPA